MSWNNRTLRFYLLATFACWLENSVAVLRTPSTPAPLKLKLKGLDRSYSFKSIETNLQVYYDGDREDLTEEELLDVLEDYNRRLGKTRAQTSISSAMHEGGMLGSKIKALGSGQQFQRDIMCREQACYLLNFQHLTCSWKRGAVKKLTSISKLCWKLHDVKFSICQTDGCM